MSQILENTEELLALREESKRNREIIEEIAKELAAVKQQYYEEQSRLEQKNPNDDPFTIKRNNKQTEGDLFSIKKQEQISISSSPLATSETESDDFVRDVPNGAGQQERAIEDVLSYKEKNVLNDGQDFESESSTISIGPDQENFNNRERATSANEELYTADFTEPQQYIEQPSPQPSQSSVLSWLKIDKKPEKSKPNDLDWIINGDDDPAASTSLANTLPPLPSQNKHNSKSQSNPKISQSLAQQAMPPSITPTLSNFSKSESQSGIKTSDIDDESNDSLIDLVQATQKTMKKEAAAAPAIESDGSLFSDDSDFAPLPPR